MATVSLRPHIVRVMSEHRERPLSTREIYEAVATMGVACFDPRAKRDRFYGHPNCPSGSPPSPVPPSSSTDPSWA